MAAEVMSYAERKARREAEISGLKEALEILSPTRLRHTELELQDLPALG